MHKFWMWLARFALKRVRSGLAMGGVVGRVKPFPLFGEVPSAYPARLMGEAEPEAIMPLARNPDGSLAVHNVTIRACDTAAFRRGVYPK